MYPFNVGRWTKYCDQSVGLSVGLCISENIPNVLYMLVVDPALSSCLKCSMLFTSCFVDDVTFSPNGANGPVLKTTPMSQPARQMLAPVGRQTTLFG